MFDIFNEKLHKDDIDKRRKNIKDLIIQQSDSIRNGNIKTITTADLKLLFQMYDQIFLGSWFKDNFKGKLKFSLSRQMTRSAGLTRCPKNIDSIKPEELIIEIKIGVDFFFEYDSIEGSKTVGGIKTSNSLEALQLVFEHELCHVIEFIHFKRSSCGKKRFKDLVNNLFGHTESCHKLPTQRQIASQKLGLNIGDTVSFTFEGRELTGLLYSIKKRATVMVRNNDGSLTDSKGNRYFKYYVPLNLLR